MKRASCQQCLRPKSVCYCHTVMKVSNHWPVSILQHPQESKHAIGTARIAELSLSHCQLEVGERLDTGRTVLELPQTVLIYPGDDAAELDSLVGSSPKTLLFLDASWRKSHRMLMESPELQSLPKISLRPDQVSRYRIRKSSTTDSLSTLEAIVFALSVLERDSDKYLPLLQTMDWMIEKQIECMGEAVFNKNYLK